MRNIAMLLGLFLTLAVPNVWAQGKPVCSLLTASDVSAVGATGQGIPGEMPISNGPPKGDRSGAKQAADPRSGRRHPRRPGTRVRSRDKQRPDIGA